MAGPRLISIIGRKNAGKTTLTVALVAEFIRRGKRVMTVKHGHHSANLDTEGTDSWRHFHEGKAERVLLAGPDGRVLFDRVPDLYDPVALARQYFADADIVLVEGFKRAPVPKIEVWRREVSPTPDLQRGLARPGPLGGPAHRRRDLPGQLPRDPLPGHDVAPPARHARVG